MSETHKPFHVRVTRIHATGAATSRDVDIRDREHWKRLVRGAKETMEQGGEHHMRPLYLDDSPATSVPAPLKVRVEALEAGIRKALENLGALQAELPCYHEHLNRAMGAFEYILERPAASKDPSA